MTDCFRCGADDHLSRDCPNHTREQPTPEPAPAKSRAAPPPGYDTPVPWFLPQDPAIAHRCAQAIREAMGWAQPGSEEEATQTEFARRYGYPARTETQRRALAAEQVAEFRRDRLADLTPG